MRPNLTPQELEELRKITNRDPYPNNFPDDYDKSKVDPRVRLRTSAVKNKLIGLDTREAMEQAPEIISVVATEAKDLSNETSERQDELEDRWETVLAETTDGAEVIDARTGLRGTSWPTIKGRLDSMQAIDDKLNPVSEILSIEHNQFGYPLVRVFSLEYGLGVVPLESEPVFGGSSTITVNSDVEYVDRNNLKVKVPLGYMMTSPTIERISANEYLLVEGIKSLIIEVGTKTEANVETFITKEIQSDFNTPPKLSNSLSENKNDFRYGLSTATSVQLPTAAWGAGEQIHIDGIKKLDGVSANLSRVGTGVICQWLIKYDVLWILEQNFPLIFKNATTTAEKVTIVQNKISAMTYTINGKGSGPSTTSTTMAVWQNTTWTGNLTKTGTTIQEFKQTPSQYSNKIDANGLVNLIFYSAASDGTKASSVSIDYTNITLTARVPFPTI